MTLSRNVLACFALLIASTGAFADATVTNSPSPASASPAPKAAMQAKAKPGDKNAAAAPATNSVANVQPTPATMLALKFDDYIKDLATELNLTDSEKKEISGYYLADTDKLKQILNDDALSPLQQSQQVADLRSARNAKIGDLLHEFQRQRDFLKVEARYRVALTELAANGGLVAAAATPPATPAAK